MWLWGRHCLAGKGHVWDAHVRYKWDPFYDKWICVGPTSYALAHLLLCIATCCLIISIGMGPTPALLLIYHVARWAIGSMSFATSLSLMMWTAFTWALYLLSTCITLSLSHYIFFFRECLGYSETLVKKLKKIKFYHKIL